MEKIVIEFIPHHRQRYNSPGDYWYDENGDLRVRVSDLGDVRMNTLVALHEIVEELTSNDAGITEEVIMAFDLMFEKERRAGLHKPEDEPGWDKRSPYRDFHAFAEKIERMVCKKLGIKWKVYEQSFNNL